MSKKDQNATSNKVTLKHVKGKAKLITVTCPTCNGSGKRGNGTCGLCDGDGTIQVVNE